jgi:hypothetical protein
MMSEWISVKDKLPEKHADILILDNRDRVACGYWSINWSGLMYWHTARRCYDDGDKLDYITHWMLMPTPPNVDKEK